MSFDFDDDDQLPDSAATLPASTQSKDTISSGAALFRSVNFGQYIPPPPANNEELLASIWPGFDRDSPPNFMSLLPPKKAYFIGKTPLKPPRPVQPTKISLELEQDQEKLFRLSGTATYRQRAVQEEAEQKGLIFIENEDDKDKNTSDDEDVFMEIENEPIGGVGWHDIEVACEDWDSMLLDEPSDSEPAAGEKRPREDDLFGEGDDDWDREFGVPQAKVRD
jgi:transcription initiation factor TFIID subunit 1